MSLGASVCRLSRMSWAQHGFVLHQKATSSPARSVLAGGIVDIEYGVHTVVGGGGYVSKIMPIIYSGQGIYSGLPICPKCQSSEDVVEMPIRFKGVTAYKKAIRLEDAIWFCNKCSGESHWDFTFYTPPQSHFICCGRLTCLNCLGRGWFRR